MLTQYEIVELIRKAKRKYKLSHKVEGLRRKKLNFVFSTIHLMEAKIFISLNHIYEKIKLQTLTKINFDLLFGYWNHTFEENLFLNSKNPRKK